jgi:hypothetical protein
MIPRKEVEMFRDLFDKALKDTVPDGKCVCCTRM